VSLRNSIMLGVWLACVCACAGELNPPVQVGADLGSIESAAFIIDPSGNPTAAVTAGGRLYYLRGQDGFATALDVGGADPAWKTGPALAMNSAGVTYLACWARTGRETYEVAWTSNPGGLFKAPSYIAGSATARPCPLTVALVRSGAVVGWSTAEGAGHAHRNNQAMLDQVVMEGLDIVGLGHSGNLSGVFVHEQHRGALGLHAFVGHHQ